ncbi:(2S)-3-sulfopropanediol dehydratase activating enzyme [Desulfobulbus oralis]|uniref:Pyruvate formate lyase-activating protein n=1 Tax=Desulfobulbus oralis TaxID=1986146 RepID=A0A2L1GPV2_9BACT|nr:glycyl-radical enzyme activating protein [Desulfobulbus oralis]AVD71703.1 pyruvate formate lyase-activating protein [Desulfobulbus oralis]
MSGVDKDQDLAQTGTVFNIQKYSVHDGPGIRTIVFSKGCSLRCRWCSNPESQLVVPELAYNRGRCLEVDKCGHCIDACPSHAIRRGDDDKPVLDRKYCADCAAMPCVAACPAQALLVYGSTRSVADVLSAVQKDAIFYSRSGGGMTISGGEPLLHADFAVALLRQARAHRLKTAVETCAMVPAATLRAAAPYLNYVLFDLKHMDSAVHKEQTGHSNETILENFRILVTEFPELPVLARTPVIPGFNDNEASIRAIAEFIKPYGQVEYEMLPYHRLGTQKYEFLGRTPPMGATKLDEVLFSRLLGVAKEVLGARVRNPA